MQKLCGVDLDYDVLGPINVSTPIQDPGDGFGENIVTGNVLKTGLMCFRYNRFWSEPSGTANHIPAGTTIDYNQKTYKNNGTSLTYGTGNVYITAFEPATYEYDKVAAFGYYADGYTPLRIAIPTILKMLLFHWLNFIRPTNFVR